MNLFKWMILLLTLAGLQGCSQNVRQANGLSVGQYLQIQSELAIRRCHIFSSGLSFWSGPSESLCLFKLRTDIGSPPPIGVLRTGTRLKITRIAEINAVDFFDTVVRLRAEHSGTEYLVQLLGTDSPVETLREALER